MGECVGRMAVKRKGEGIGMVVIDTRAPLGLMDARDASNKKGTQYFTECPIVDLHLGINTSHLIIYVIHPFPGIHLKILPVFPGSIGDVTNPVR